MASLIEAALIDTLGNLKRVKELRADAANRPS
jgi:hypothetical protein